MALTARGRSASAGQRGHSTAHIALLAAEADRSATAAVVRDRGIVGAGQVGDRVEGAAAAIYLAVAVALQRQQDASSDLDAGLIPITIPELLRLLRDIVIPTPRRDRAHRLHWSAWRRRHQHRARQAHRRWNAYAETTP